MTVIEPIPADPDWLRYSCFSLPPYRFVKGRTPHPRRDPRGHSFGKPEPQVSAFTPQQWRTSVWYLYGVDLYNFAYWWESHEVFESLWHAVGHQTKQGLFFQALIHVAAANIKRFLGVDHAADHLSRRALERLQTMPRRYMGMDLEIFAEDVRSYFSGTRGKPALISLSPDRVGIERGERMAARQYPRSPKLCLGGMAHLLRFLDKVRLRHKGLIQDYNYVTVGFDKYLLDLLQIKGEDLERRVLEGGTDEELLAWVRAHGRSPTAEELRQWNDRILLGGPNDEAARQRFQARLAEVACQTRRPR